MASPLGDLAPADESRALTSPSAQHGLSDRALLLITATVTLPVLWMGYGTDIDVANVLRSGRAVRALGYEPSRNPGVPVFEAIAAILEPVGGHLAINLATAGAAAAVVVGIARLVRNAGHPNSDVIALAFLASPVTLIAATSTGDFLWAMALFVWGALAHLRGSSPVAAILLALAIGSRSSTVVIIAALLLADGWIRANRRRCIATATMMVPLAIVLYVPAWLAHDRTLAFLARTEDYNGVVNNLGRLLYKNYAAWGIAMVVVVTLAVPALVRALRRWNDEPLVRFGVLAATATEVMFFFMPWKAAHLLPALLAVLVWIAASERNHRRYLWLLIAAIAVHGVVAFRPLAPDTPNASRTAHLDPTVTWGLLLNDVRCRLEYMDETPSTDSGAFDCSQEPVRGPVHDEPASWAPGAP